MIECEKFRTPKTFQYPLDTSEMFEEYFYKYFLKSTPNIDRVYIPVFWTNYYISKDFGQGDMSDLQLFLNKLDRDKKYFTVVQYDDNIINDIDDLDILIFAQGGYGKYKDKSYPIPLNCQTNNLTINPDKNIFCSFVGRETHPIRRNIINLFEKNPRYFISKSTSYEGFKSITSNSIFTLCPRGYGQTSFRICESLQLRSIPVYIYDDPLIPFKSEFNFSDIGVLVHQDAIEEIDHILNSVSDEEIKKMKRNGQNFYEKYFGYEGCRNTIIKILENEVS
jgi:hypothetical protein